MSLGQPLPWLSLYCPLTVPHLSLGHSWHIHWQSLSHPLVLHSWAWSSQGSSDPVYFKTLNSNSKYPDFNKMSQTCFHWISHDFLQIAPNWNSISVKLQSKIQSLKLTVIGHMLAADWMLRVTTAPVQYCHTVDTRQTLTVRKLFSGELSPNLITTIIIDNDLSEVQ